MTARLISVILAAVLFMIPVTAFSAEEGHIIKDMEKADAVDEIYGAYNEPLAAEEETVLPCPSGFKAKGTDYNKIKLTWNRVEGATGYKIYRYKSDKKKYILIKTLKRGNIVKYTDEKLQPKTSYSYKIRAYSEDSLSSLSEKVKGKTLKSYKGVSLVKPLKKMNLISAYGNRGGAFHIGADYGAPKGTPVYAAASGLVTRSRSNYGGLGEGIVIRHSNGLVTWYGHLNSRSVKAGQRVKAGDKIGTVGSTGNASCNHLHFEVWINGKTYNPNKFF